jgi:hypothetical protein
MTGGGLSMEKPPFDPDEEYDVQADFILYNATHKRGAPFDKSLVNTRLLRRLYDIGLLRFRPKAQPAKGLAHQPTGTVTFVPTARTGRAR